VPDANSLDERVRLKRIRQYFGHAAGNMASALAGGLLIALVLRSAGVSPLLLGCWLGTIGLVSLAVTLFERRIQRTGITLENSGRLLNARIGLGCLIGLAYGVAPFLGYQSITPQHAAFLFIILSTMVGVASMGYSVMPRYYVLLDVVTLVPLTALFVSRGGSQFTTFAVVSVVWQVVVLRKAGSVSRSSIAAIEANERLQDETDEHRRTREQMQHMALHDMLTGLANRRMFAEEAARSILLANRERLRAGIIVIDLDDFKPVNDSYGHHAGDLVLQEVAARMQRTIRGSDLSARTGGDEFTLLLQNVHAGDEVALIEAKIVAALEEPIEVEGRTLRVRASAGHAIFPDDGDALAPLLRVADARMYERKRRPGGQPADQPWGHTSKL